jgi:hypothetical protein
MSQVSGPGCPCFNAAVCHGAHKSQAAATHFAGVLYMYLCRSMNKLFQYIYELARAQMKQSLNVQVYLLEYDK